MGELAVDNVSVTKEYGILAVNFNLLRQFYNCVKETVEQEEPASVCQNTVLDNSETE